MIIPALPTPDDGGALDDWQVTQVFEGVDQHAQRQTSFLQQTLSLGNLKKSILTNCYYHCLNSQF